LAFSGAGGLESVILPSDSFGSGGEDSGFFRVRHPGESGIRSCHHAISPNPWTGHVIENGVAVSINDFHVEFWFNKFRSPNVFVIGGILHREFAKPTSTRVA
jgi:hypothetical protein